MASHKHRKRNAEPLEPAGLSVRKYSTSGFVDSLSLCAEYDFPLSVLHAPESASYALRTEWEKTLYHETTHLYQLLATSYGYYYEMLQDFQTLQVMLILRDLKEKGLELRTPLRLLSAQLQDTTDVETISRATTKWLAAELLLAFLEGDAETFLRLEQKITHDTGYPTEILFPLIDYDLGNFLEISGRAQLEERPQPPESPADPIQNATLWMLKITHPAGDMSAVLESAATAAEYWGEPGASFQRMAEFGTPLRHKMAPYYSLIQDARQHMSRHSVHEFMLTYSVLCDIALNSPLLPHHRSLRNHAADLTYLHPFNRLTLAVQAAGELPPIRNFDADYQPFVQAITRKCKWPSMEDTWNSSARQATPGGSDIIGGHDGDVYTEAYARAAKLRIAKPSIFSNLGVWRSINGTAEEIELKSYFMHPVMQYRDGVVSHQDKGHARRFIRCFLLRSYLRQLFISAKIPTIVLPYRADKDVLNDWRRDLLGSLTDLGLENSDVRIIPAPLSI